MYQLNYLYQEVIYIVFLVLRRCQSLFFSFNKEVWFLQIRGKVFAD